MGGDRRPVRYKHETCNVSSGAVHLFVSTERKIQAAFRLVRCVQSEGIRNLEDAMERDDIYQILMLYADCVGKLENALLVIGNHSAIYDDILADLAKEYTALARRLLDALDAMAQGYDLSARWRLRGAG